MTKIINYMDVTPLKTNLNYSSGRTNNRQITVKNEPDIDVIKKYNHYIKDHININEFNSYLNNEFKNKDNLNQIMLKLQQYNEQQFQSILDMVVQLNKRMINKNINIFFKDEYKDMVFSSRIPSIMYLIEQQEKRVSQFKNEIYNLYSSKAEFKKEWNFFFSEK